MPFADSLVDLLKEAGSTEANPEYDMVAQIHVKLGSSMEGGWMDLITDAELTTLREYHQAMPSNPKFCRGCANLSPCPTARLILDMEELEGVHGALKRLFTRYTEKYYSYRERADEMIKYWKDEVAFLQRQLEGRRILSNEFEARCRAAGLIE